MTWSWRRVRWVVAAIALSVGTLLLAALVTGWTATRRSSVAQDRLGPVVLVPGYGGGTGGLTVLAARLRRAGHSTVVLHLAGDGTGDLHAQAHLLEVTVDGLLARGAPSVDVVGYSAGGIVTRLWATDLGGATRARRIVLLGSPNHGSQIAGLASQFSGGLCPQACQQLVPGSDLLRALNAQGTPAGPGWVSVWTEQDQVVTPADSAQLDGAANVIVQSVCSGAQVDHSGLPTDRVVESIVVRALAAAPFTIPSANDCPALGSR